MVREGPHPAAAANLVRILHRHHGSPAGGVVLRGKVVHLLLLLLLLRLWRRRRALARVPADRDARVAVFVRVLVVVREARPRFVTSAAYCKRSSLAWGKPREGTTRRWRREGIGSKFTAVCILVGMGRFSSKDCSWKGRFSFWKTLVPATDSFKIA